MYCAVYMYIVFVFEQGQSIVAVCLLAVCSLLHARRFDGEIATTGELCCNERAVGLRGDLFLCDYFSSRSISQMPSRQWSTAEDRLLRRAVQKYGEASWARVASDVPQRSASACRGRSERMRKRGSAAAAAVPLTRGGTRLLVGGGSGNLVLQIVGIYRYKADASFTALSGEAATNGDDVYDVVLSDGAHKLKCLLSPKLNGLVQTGELAPLVLAKVRQWRCDVDECDESVAPDVLPVIEGMRRQADVSPSTLLQMSAGSALSWHTRSSLRGRSGRPLVPGRRWYIPLSNSDCLTHALRLQLPGLSAAATSAALDCFGGENPDEEWVERELRWRVGDRDGVVPVDQPTISELLQMCTSARSANAHRRREVRCGVGGPIEDALVGVVVRKSMLYGGGFFSNQPRQPCPVRFVLRIADASGMVNVVVWNARCAELYASVCENDIVRITNFRAKMWDGVAEFSINAGFRSSAANALETGDHTTNAGGVYVLRRRQLRNLPAARIRVPDASSLSDNENSDDDGASSHLSELTPDLCTAHGLLSLAPRPTDFGKTATTETDGTNTSSAATSSRAASSAAARASGAERVGDDGLPKAIRRCDIVGVVVFVGRRQREHRPRSDEGHGRFVEWIWVRLRDHTSSHASPPDGQFNQHHNSAGELVCQLYANSQPDVLTKLIPGDVLACTRMNLYRVCAGASSRDDVAHYLTSSLGTKYEWRRSARLLPQRLAVHPQVRALARWAEKVATTSRERIIGNEDEEDDEPSPIISLRILPVRQCAQGQFIVGLDVADPAANVAAVRRRTKARMPFVIPNVQPQLRRPDRLYLLRALRPRDPVLSFDQVLSLLTGNIVKLGETRSFRVVGALVGIDILQCDECDDEAFPQRKPTKRRRKRGKAASTATKHDTREEIMAQLSIQSLNRRASQRNERIIRPLLRADALLAPIPANGGAFSSESEAMNFFVAMLPFDGSSTASRLRKARAGKRLVFWLEAHRDRWDHVDLYARGIFAPENASQ